MGRRSPGLGLVGAYVTPLLVSTGQPSFWALYLYLAVVTAAAFTLARARLWRWLAVTAVVFGAFWAFPGCRTLPMHSTAPHVFYAVVCFALAAALIVPASRSDPTPSPTKIDGDIFARAGRLSAAAALVVIASGHDTLALVGFSLLAAAAVAHRLAGAVEHARRAGGGRSGRAAVCSSGRSRSTVGT